MVPLVALVTGDPEVVLCRDIAGAQPAYGTGIASTCRGSCRCAIGSLPFGQGRPCTDMLDLVQLLSFTHLPASSYRQDGHDSEALKMHTPYNC